MKTLLGRVLKLYYLYDLCTPSLYPPNTDWLYRAKGRDFKEEAPKLQNNIPKDQHKISLIFGNYRSQRFFSLQIRIFGVVYWGG